MEPERNEQVGERPDLDLGSATLVQQAIRTGAAGARKSNLPMIQLRIGRDLYPGFDREIDAIAIDLFSEFGLVAVPAYLDTGCITLGFQIREAPEDAHALAGRLRDERGRAFAWRYNVTEIVLRQMYVPDRRKRPAHARPRGHDRLRIVYR